MNAEYHLAAFQERKNTLFKWALEIQGLERSQRIVGDNASRGIVELLSAYLHKAKKISEGKQINHRWFKSEKAEEKLPEFKNKREIVAKMIRLEGMCEQLSYGAPRPVSEIERVIKLFKEIEKMIGVLE